MTSPGVCEPDVTDGSPVSLSTALAADLVAHRSGDRAAAGRLARRATPFLWHIARAAGADATTAEDAVQNTMIALIRRGGEIQQPEAVLKWLIVTVRRDVWRMLRSSGRVDLVADSDAGLPLDPRTEPDQVSLTRERDVVLWRTVRLLSARCQYLLRVIAFADRPDYAAICDALGMRLGSIGPTRRRCLDKLQELLAAEPRWGET